MEFWEDYEMLRVETPENLDLYLPLAGFGPRFLAFFIDVMIVGVVQVALGAMIIGIGVAWGVGSGLTPDWVAMIIFGLLVVVLLLLPVIYFAVFESIWHGQSPGKRLSGIRVIRRGGFPIGRREILWRNVLRIIDMLPTYGVVGLISFFATRNQQRLGDLVADTVVVREFTKAQPFSWAGSIGGEAGQQRPQTGAVTPELAYAIGSYLQRAGELNAEARAALTRRCIEALGYSAAHLSLPERESYLHSVLQQSWGQR